MDGGTRPHARRVVVVDDHDRLREMMCTLVESWGHSVRAAATGRQALALTLSWRPDVVCLDVGLPIFSGYEVARRIAAMFEDRRPLLVATAALAREVDRRRADEAGFDLFVVKPFGVEMLRDVLTGGQVLPARA